MGLAITAFTGMLASAGAATPAPGANLGYVALANSVPATTDNVTGSYSSSRMQIEVAVAPRDEAGLNTMLAALYDKNSPSYHHWLTNGQFDARYGPTPAARAAVAKFLSSSGLSVVPSGSPYLVRATGSSAQIQRTFHTQLNTFKDPQGTKYFANSTPVYLPSSLAGSALGVVGLTNTVRNAVHSKHFRNTMRRPAKASATTSCETGYPTAQQLFAFFDNGTNFPSGYGAGPGCSGLTPSQDNSLYGAPNLGARGKGKGVDIAVFELSAYQHSDIATWAHQFYGPGYNPPLVDVNVDGGPLNPQCPVGDTCPPEFNGYAGDIEVDADIQMQLAIAPDVSHLIVYNAPNDFTGQTELDEWSAIAKANVADSVSSSWAVCENDATAGYVQAENTIFRQMAAQGQSVFGAEGDTGAFSCLRSDGGTNVNLLDPPAQPWVTSVGGTSFENFNPGTNPHPSYPRVGEAVWNVQNLCSNARPARPPAGGTASSGAGPPEQAVAGQASTGACPRTRRAGGLSTPTPPSVTARPSARWPRSARRAVRRRTSPPTPTSSRRTPSTAPATRTPRSASAPRSAAASPSPAGSASAGPACPRRWSRRSSPTGTASTGTAPATSTGRCTGSTRSPRRSSSTTSPGQATSPRTTACSRRCPDLTWRPGSARSRWPRSSSGPSRNNPPAAGTGSSRPRRPHVRPRAP
jgi:hypothetical protein